MARRPSTVSLSSVGSGSGLSKLTQLPPLPPLISRSSSKSLPNGSPLTSRQVSVNAQVDLAKIGEAWDPDELFTKHTVAEVKLIQQRLRTDADAKQEELRLMVGERYRDLLQASTSIISLAKSSDRVVVDLKEMRTITSSIQTVQSPKLSGHGQGDIRLHSLQSLAAHLKLLLDSSEHLWRLMEKKLYLHAAWLFLLSRVVHRSLLRHGEDEDEEGGWASLGIDISEQFPLVQRQWEAISQFRSQIAHKATLSLRESTLSSPEVCAILLALHLLESRPFSETLNTFLAQRNRCLTAALVRPKDRLVNGNGSALDASLVQAGSSDKRSRKAIVRDVKQRLKTVLDIVSRTLGSARIVFIGEPEHLPLMQRVLTYIQSPSPAASDDLPSEVRLTSQILLSTLPSSNHFLLLPATIKSYKPYVDIDSLSSQKGVRFAAGLVEWFDTSMRNIRSSMISWLAELTTIRELWESRTWCRKWLRANQGLRPDENASFNTSMDMICRQRAVEIWKAVLASTEVIFREHLDSALSELGQAAGQDSLDAQPIRYLLQSPLVSLSSPSGPGASTPFQKYSISLQQQIAGRTPLLQDVLTAVESRVQVLRDDLDTMDAQDEDTQLLASKLVEDYRADADSLCESLCTTLQSPLDSSGVVTESSLRQTLFVARVADDLSSSARLMTSVGCSPTATDSFRDRLKAIHDIVVEQWQSHVIRSTVDHYWTGVNCDVDVDVEPSAPDGSPSRPSAAAVNVVLSLSTHVQQLGFLLDPVRIGYRAGQLLAAFVSGLLERLQSEPQRAGVTNFDILKDLAFLHIMVSAWGTQLSDTVVQLRETAIGIVDQSKFDTIRAELLTSVTKMQLLFGALLPPTVTLSDAKKPQGRSKAGVPVVESQYQPAVDLVKPSARFGLLLVGSSLAR